MKKRTISKLKSIFGSKKGKRQPPQEQYSKSSRSPSPERAGAASPANGDSFLPILRTPPPSRPGPPPSPPVPTHPVAPVAPEPPAPLLLMPCAVCGRTFMPQSLAKHVKICEKMTVKKRKRFDSSRQRREGTDLEQYLPKNFGLPENSPFIEKSPPPTAKPTPKPKPQSVRNAITKPMAELQRCPHCNRAFGSRAFERHVEWCADKAKILPAGPAQPPQQLADAKQRLNARTQYKAPPVRGSGRRSSQTRDKSSNSRSASVESSRGVSPPAREAGDYKHGRVRASESGSSNDFHDDTSPHVPVIRKSRNSQNSSGDANVKARQARLARDLSSTRNKQDPRPSSVQQSNTDPNIKKNIQNKPKSRLNAKNQQLKKLEEIADKYNERIQECKDGLKSAVKKNTDKTVQIPVCKIEKKVKQENKKPTKDIDTSKRDIKENVTNEKTKTKSLKAPSDVSLNRKRVSEKEKKIKFKENKETMKVVKESSMSLDSLEDFPPNLAGDYSRQSVGINTELLCIPCVIHENLDPKKSARRDKEKTGGRETECSNSESEPKVELLYKNPIMDNSGHFKDYEKDGYYKEDVSITNFSNSIFTPCTSDNMMCDSIESVNNFRSCKLVDNNTKLRIVENEDNNRIVNVKNEDLINNKADDRSHNLSAEHFEINYEHDLSAELFNDFENKSDDDNINEENEIERRHGSGETYTKFTEDPADLEEFMNMTDKLMIDRENKKIADDLDNFHTPATNSIEAINKKSLDDVVDTGLPKHTFDELKSNLKELLQGTNNNVNDIKKSNNACEDKITENDSDTNKNICDMEHITVYELKFYEKTQQDQNVTDNPTIELKLPAITETNKPARSVECNKKRIQKLYKPNRKYRLLSEQNRTHKEYQTFIVKQIADENSDDQSIASDAPPLKLPSIEFKRLDDTNYDPFVSAARQMKQLMSSDTNIPKKIKKSTKDLEKTRTLPALQPAKEKTPSSYLRSDNTKMMKDTLNKTYQKTPTLQRMKSFGSTNNDNSPSTFGGRCSSFRLNRNDKKPKLNTTFTKSSKENISTVDKSYFNRNSNLNRSFSSYTASSYSTPKLKDKIPKIATSMYHSFQRTTIKQPVKLDKIKINDENKDFVNLDAILADDNSSMTDSSYIDPRLINENDNLPINVNTILNNPDIISSMESLLTTENLPAKFESFNCVSQNNNNNNNCNSKNTATIIRNEKFKANNNVIKTTAPTVDDLTMQYDKLMHSLEHSIASKTSVRDDDSLCEDFDLEEFMTSFDEEIHKHKSENKRTCSSTTRVVKASELADSNRTSELNSVSSSPKVRNGMNPVNKSMSLNFSTNNIVSENLFPSSVKRSNSLLDSIHKKNLQKTDNAKSRQKVDLLEQDIMQSLKDFDKFYESEKNENHSNKDTFSYNGTAKRGIRLKSDRQTKKNETVSNGNHTPNGKATNDSAYSSMNRISPSKLSLCTPKENGLQSIEPIPAGSDSAGSHKDDVRSISSEEFLAMERSAELDEPMPQPGVHAYKEPESHAHATRASGPGRRARGSLSSSGSEASLASPPRAAPRASRFCHECGNRFPVETAKFCIECGVKRLVV